MQFPRSAEDPNHPSARAEEKHQHSGGDFFSCKINLYISILPSLSQSAPGSHAKKTNLSSFGKDKHL